MNKNPLVALSELGQSIWLDFISRPLIDGGGLKKMVEQDHLAGVTSNPSIFLNAIAKSDDYDDAIQQTLKANKRKPQEIYEALAIKDIKDAADTLRIVYDMTRGRDGFVCLEVSPHLAHDAQATILEGKKLWHEVDRPNLMIKVPGTDEGCEAISELIASGINVNVTLLFSTLAYKKAALAYLDGLSARRKKNLGLDSVHSVASFFVSRIDTKIDAKLAKIGTESAQALMGKIAIANAKNAYRIFQDLYDGDEAHALLRSGAFPQRLLWASTSSKNPNYSDVLYVDSLIGKNTVNTLPLNTLDAFRHHGRAELTLEAHLDEAKAQLATLSKLSIDFDQACRELLDEGLELFCSSFDELLAAIAKKIA